MQADGPTILALDSSAALCAAALVRGGRVCASKTEEMARGQAERLMPLAQEALAEAGCAPGDLDAVAVCIGPGNFTGVRIAVAAARGLALALGVPAVGVTRTEALAAEAEGPALASVPTRRDEIHAALFSAEGALLAEATGAPEAAAAALAPACAALDAPGAIRGAAAEILAEALGDAQNWRIAPGGESPRPETLARLAAAKLAAGDALPRPAPVYLRPADAAPSREVAPAILPG